jgi:hypothetical protein
VHAAVESLDRHGGLEPPPTNDEVEVTAIERAIEWLDARLHFQVLPHTILPLAIIVGIHMLIRREAFGLVLERHEFRELLGVALGSWLVLWIVFARVFR